MALAMEAVSPGCNAVQRQTGLASARRPNSGHRWDPGYRLFQVLAVPRPPHQNGQDDREIDHLGQPQFVADGAYSATMHVVGHDPAQACQK